MIESLLDLVLDLLELSYDPDDRPEEPVSWSSRRTGPLESREPGPLFRRRPPAPRDDDTRPRS